MCKECEKRGKTWEGDDPICAFDTNGKFKVNVYGSGDNFSCATLDMIREFMVKENNFGCSKNQSVGLISYDGMALALGWYKHRGRIEEFHVFNRINEMTDLRVCEKIIKGIIL